VTELRSTGSPAVGLKHSATQSAMAGSMYSQATVTPVWGNLLVTAVLCFEAKRLPTTLVLLPQPWREKRLAREHRSDFPQGLCRPSRPAVGPAVRRRFAASACRFVLSTLCRLRACSGSRAAVRRRAPGSTNHRRATRGNNHLERSPAEICAAQARPARRIEGDKRGLVDRTDGT